MTGTEGGGEVTLLRRVVLVVLVALLPALAAEIYNQQALQAVQRAELDADALREAGGVATEIGRILDGTRNALVALSAMPAIRDQDAPACTALLRSMVGRFAGISVLALVSADDRVVCSSVPPVPATRPPGAWAHVRLARARGRFAVAGYLLSTWTGTAQLATGRPVDGALPPGHGAVLIADLGLAWLDAQIAALTQRAEGTMLVADRNGVVLAASAGGPVPGTKLPAELGALLAGGGSGPLSVRDAGHVAVARLPDLAVLVQVAHSAAAQALSRAGARFYLMFAAGLLAGLAGALLLARRAVAAPVQRILGTIARWRGGDATARVGPADPASELGRIGAALDELLAAVARTQQAQEAQQAVLEARVAERTRQRDAEAQEREQAQARLQQAQKMEVIGQLTGGVAHDFNNLLTAIIGNLELAARRCRDRPELDRLLHGAMGAAERGASLTQRLLAFGRQQYLRPEAIDLAALLGGMEDLLARSVGPTVALRLHVPERLWRLRADANQLELVLLNLAINARDAMPAGGALVIEAENETVADAAAHPARLAPGDYVRVAIRDSGVGIAATMLARVTEPFFTTKPAGKGSGLGLSMVQGVAAQSGGGLLIDSVPGRGTTVRLWLPRALAPVAGETAVAIMQAPAAPPAPGRRVLLVDDDPAVAEVTQQCLEDAGYVVRVCADGAAALHLLESGEAVHLLLADLAMPGMDGMQLAARARRLRPGLPVLLATGYSDLSQRASALPPLPVLEKPFRAAQLIEAVAALLAEAAITAATAPAGGSRGD